MVPLAALLLVAGEVNVSLSAEQTCTTTVAIHAATDPRVPPLVPLNLALELETTDDQVRGTLALDTAGTSTATRDVDVARADCPLLPRLIASIAERYVTALPKRDWAAFRRARKLKVIVPIEPPVVPPTPIPWAWRLGFDAGGLIGVAPKGRVAVRTDVGPVEGLALSAATGADIVVDAPIGDGTIDVVSLYGAVGPSFAFDAGTATVMPEVRLRGGVHVGRARGFDTASSNLLPLLDVHAGVTMWARPLHVTIGVAVPLLRARFTRAEGDAFDEPPVRVVLTAGWSTALSTW